MELETLVATVVNFLVASCVEVWREACPLEEGAVEACFYWIVSKEDPL